MEWQYSLYLVIMSVCDHNYIINNVRLKLFKDATRILTVLDHKLPSLPTRYDLTTQPPTKYAQCFPGV